MVALKVIAGLALLGCGPGLATRGKSDEPAHATSAFLAAVNSRSVSDIEELFDERVMYAGLYFENVDCHLQFPAAGLIQPARRTAFAKCLATLELQEATRTDVLFGVSVLEYSPGIEIETVFRFIDRQPRLAWIGYSGRRDLRDGLPTITPAALEYLRIDGDRKATPHPDHARAIEAENTALGVPYAYAWMKVCIDAEGSITGTHTREVSSPRAETAFREQILRWKFRPMRLGSRAIPACATLRLTHPETADPEELPLAFPDIAGFIRVPPRQTKRIAGDITIVPNDEEKVLVQRSRVTTLVGAYRYCFDETGKVVDVTRLEPTGLLGYDRRLKEGITTWRFAPYMLDGKAVKVCTGVKFIYKQQR